MKRLLFILLLLLPLGARAAPEASARVGLDTDKTWWVGQRVLVQLDLLTTGFSFSGQRFNLPQIEGGVLLQTDTTTIKLSEQIEGESWQILRYELSLFSQREGVVEVPPINVRFSVSMGYGQPQVPFDLVTEPISVTLSLPPGTDSSMPVITSSGMTIREQWQPDVTELRAGDALMRTLTIEAEDVSGIALPPMPVSKVEGIDLLPGTPEVRDKTGRGELSGYRKEQLSYLFTQAGEYSLPGIQLSWWNPEQERLESFEYEARQVTVLADTSRSSEAPDSSAQASGYQIRVLIFGLVALFLLGALAFARWPRKGQTEDSESQRFKHALRACASHDPKRALKNINTWLNMIHLNFAGSDQDAWEVLQRAVVNAEQNWNGSEMENALKRARRDYIERRKRDENKALPPLNPVE